MGNGDDSCVLEPLSDHLLHESIGLHVKIRGGLVKEEDFISAEKHSCETNQLLLAQGEEFWPVCDLGVKLVGEAFHITSQTCLLKGLPELFIRNDSERVKVVPDSTFEEEGSLGDHWDVFSQGMKTHLQSVVPIDRVSAALLWFYDSEKWEEDWWLTCSWFSDNSNFLAFFNIEGNIVENEWQSFSVADWEVLNFEGGVLRPLLIDYFSFFFSIELLRQACLSIIVCS